MGLFNLFKSKPKQQEELLKDNDKNEISDFFKIDINNIMSYKPEFISSSKNTTGYDVKKYLLNLPQPELSIFNKLEILDVSKENYNLIFKSSIKTMSKGLIEFVNFCVDKFGIDMSGEGKIHAPISYGDQFTRMWNNGIMIDNTEGFSIILHGIKKEPNDIIKEESYIEDNQKQPQPIVYKEKLKFKGIYVEGNADDFVSELEKVGFENKNDNVRSFFIFMTGFFMNKNCSIAIVYTPTERLLAKLLITFEDRDSWETLKNEYFQTKEIFKKKYVEDDSLEDFLPPHYEGDGEEIEAVEDNLCVYKTCLSAENGGIIIEITDNKEVCITYEHKDNFDLYLKEKEQSQLDEI